MKIVQLFLNGNYWRDADIPGMNNYFQVKVIEPDGKQSWVACYVEQFDDIEINSYIWHKGCKVSNKPFVRIEDKTLEPDPENPYALRRIHEPK